MKQIVFLKGELDTRPTTFQEHLCQARNSQSYHAYGSQRNGKEKNRARMLSSVLYSSAESGCLSGKWFLSLDGLVREVLLAFGLGKFVMFFSKERRGAVVSKTATAFIVVDFPFHGDTNPGLEQINKNITRALLSMVEIILRAM